MAPSCNVPLDSLGALGLVIGVLFVHLLEISSEHTKLVTIGFDVKIDNLLTLAFGASSS